MAREFDMCEVCKLDETKKCDYTCVKQRSDFMFRFLLVQILFIMMAIQSQTQKESAHY